MSKSRTRAANEAFDGDQESPARPQQRRRIEHDDGGPAAPAASALSLTDLNDNVLVLIMSFLAFQELNEVAMCSRRCREIRSHESLDQTRVGTIVFNENTTPTSFYNALTQRRWNGVFSGNRTHLNLVGLERVQAQNWARCEPLPPDAPLRLHGVVKLDVLCDQENAVLDVPHQAFEFVLSAFLNLKELDASYLKLDVEVDMPNGGRTLERVTWTGCDSLRLSGYDLRFCSSLAELSIDHFVVNDYPAPRDLLLTIFASERTEGPLNCYMWKACTYLERLSMKHATFICQDMAAPEPVTQGMLIKMVRNLQSLRWLRSDLTEENVAMLKQERPEITFVAD